MPNVELQGRDYELFRGLLDSRVMSLSHATTLYFSGTAESAKKRVQKLKAAGFVGERKKLPGDPSILYLTKKSFLALQNAGCLPTGRHLTWAFLEGRPRVSDLTLRHELAVMDVKTAFCEAVAKTGTLTIADFTTWPLFFSFKAKPSLYRERLMKPDGFLRLSEKTTVGTDELTFFLEVDRSTEVQSTLVEKATCYRHYYQSGGFAARMGGTSARPQEFPFRVLLIVPNEERRNNAAESLLRATPPILSLVWLTTREELIADPLGSIWMRPVDYRDAMVGTAFDPLRRELPTGYRRQSEREALARKKIKLHRLLEA